MYKVYNVYIRYMMLLVHSGKIFVLVQQGQELGYRNSKITFKEENMTAEQKKKCHAIIHAASVAAGGAGAGMAQIPGSDNTYSAYNDDFVRESIWCYFDRISGKSRYRITGGINSW